MLEQPCHWLHLRRLVDSHTIKMHSMFKESDEAMETAQSSLSPWTQLYFRKYHAFL
jgi:hypothetical protein